MEKEIKREIQTVVDRIVDQFHPERIILFGSYAAEKEDQIAMPIFLWL